MHNNLLVTLLLVLFSVLSAQTYQADWDSLKNYQAPEWYEDAKPATK